MREARRAIAAGFLVVLAAVFVASLLDCVALRAQKAERGTQRWIIAGDFSNHQVEVVDTSGVCLYIVSGNGTGIAAVPKSQLPVGAGCQ